MSSYVALKLANIDDQKFLPAVEEKFREVQEKLTRYVQKHEARAIGAKAVLTVKITLAVEKSQDPSIKAEIETKVPSDPPHLSIAQFGTDKHGPCVQVQRAGSYGDSPRQGRMFTEDGRRIDPNTGEILDPPAPPDDRAPEGTKDIDPYTGERSGQNDQNPRPPENQPPQDHRPENPYDPGAAPAA
ncbi:MAG: hypothetical protein JXB13_00995 [Phycisphaerae bacterium]|nr:hypothetical protein [Phycisphaerae bacterium]